MDKQVIMLLLLTLVLIITFVQYRKLKWEKLILKRQIKLGTVNIHEDRGTHFRLGSLSTLSAVLLLTVINPGIIDGIGSYKNTEVEYAEVDVVIETQKVVREYVEVEVPVEVIVTETVIEYVESKSHNFETFNDLLTSSDIDEVVYGTVIGKEETEKFTFMVVEVTNSTSNKTNIKVFQSNDDLLLEIGSSYLMVLSYSVNLDYYYGIGDNQAFFKEVDGLFKPLIIDMFPEIEEMDLEKEKFLDDLFSIIG
ncbi:hypothetical protein RJG79_12500 [Mycoplasmatota bacterium WC44]